MKKLNLKNRRGQIIVGILTKPECRVIGTAVLQHGYGGVKERAQIQTMQNIFLQKGFQVFNFDSPNSFGESDGEYKNARQGLHADDFEDVTNWTRKQDWFTGKLIVSGHSMGGFASIRYALRNSSIVDYVISLAPVISGELIWAARRKFELEIFEKWEQDGVLFQDSKTIPGKVKEKPWEVMTEYLNHSLFKEQNYNPPILLISCQYDTSIPPDHIQIFHDSLTGDKTHMIIEG